MSPRCLLLALIVAGPGLAAGPPTSRRVPFADVHSLLDRHCLRCHRGTNPVSGVRLDSRAEWLGENNGRPLALPGQSATSRVIQAVKGHPPEKQMPPEGRGKRLRAEEVALLRDWIDQGLAWDDRLLPPPVVDHWAFRPIRRPAVPAVDPLWQVRTPIDAFLVRGWQQQGLRPNAEASRRTLLRRLAFDLMGLPPTREEIERFECDPSPEAYDRAVERLLASPAYGERWARHWLDVARYADSEGYESNHLRPHAWRYRDWVVASFDQDRPFGDFVTQQLAGDEMRPASDESLVATGFLAAARLSSNEEDKPRQRNDILVDVVNTTASAFLGLTMHCAQCHNHKFDPITARDYYRFQAFFVTGQPANVALLDPTLHTRWREGLPAGFEAVHARREAILARAKDRLIAATLRELPAEQRRALEIAPERRSEAEEYQARQAELRLQFSPGRIEREVPAEDRKEYDTLRKRLEAWAKTVADEPQAFAFVAPGTASTTWRTLPMKGFYPLPYEPEQLPRLRSRLLLGGDVHRWGAALTPGWPAVFGPTPTRLEPTPRLALARWLTSPDNPLVARVWVNRVWQWHFGTGLMATPSDFGLKGARPTHPELLDWLAAEFLASGGSTKHLHRLIVRSRAYRLASTVQSENQARDPENRYLWRWQPRRLEAEAIRDALLAVAGELEQRRGGPGEGEEASSRRRGVYLFQRRDHPPMFQALFDGPVASAESCPRRGVSTVPLQALYLLNNGFARGQAAALAGRVETEAGPERARQIDEVFRRVLGRHPEAGERRAAERLFERHGGQGALTSLCQAVMSVNEFVYLE